VAQVQFFVSHPTPAVIGLEQSATTFDKFESSEAEASSGKGMAVTVDKSP
jgi:hypothetical protein